MFSNPDNTPLKIWFPQWHTGPCDCLHLSCSGFVPCWTFARCRGMNNSILITENYLRLFFCKVWKCQFAQSLVSPRRKSTTAPIFADYTDICVKRGIKIAGMLSLRLTNNIHAEIWHCNLHLHTEANPSLIQIHFEYSPILQINHAAQNSGADTYIFQLPRVGKRQKKRDVAGCLWRIWMKVACSFYAS